MTVLIEPSEGGCIGIDGGHLCPKSLEVAKASDFVITIVGYPDDVRQVYLGREGVLAGAGKGSILVDMTTSQPSLAQEIAKAADSQGIETLDAPVSGGDIGAREARLSIMVEETNDFRSRVATL